ncbi:MAG: HEAT repeat domain-containing protein [Anaerolineae bacterium]|jgi:hypothetical protein|nr:HEAT repeat domain-containing protein [Anaerolineae bacterium]
MSDSFQPDIWRLQAQYDIQGLMSALTAADPGIRRRAAAALRTMGAKEALPALRLALKNETEADVQAALSAALEALTEAAEEEQPAGSAGAAATRAAIARLQHSDPQQVIQAARDLGTLGDKLAVEPLVMIFNDVAQTMPVRLAVAEALLKLESAPVEVALLGNLRSPEWETRRKAAAILGQLKAAWAVQPLATALRDPHPMVKKTALAALKHINTPDARRILNRVLAQLSGAKPAAAAPPPAAAAPPAAPASPPLPTVYTDATMPAAPRSGLLKRFQKDGDPDPARPDASNPVYTMPTQPLDPEVLRRAEERRQQPPDDAAEEKPGD